jgi:Ca2+-binding EF-hand superfamily protein
MKHVLFSATLLGLALIVSSAALGADQTNPAKKPVRPPAFLNDTPEQFIKRFDKNKDGVLTKDEVPPFLARNFDRLDTNGDGKLDRKEVAVFLRNTKLRFNSKKTPSSAEIDRVVTSMLERLDKDKDGKISKKEAQGRPLAKLFDQLDTNKDGFLDKKELRQAAARFLQNQNGKPQGAPRQGRGPAAGGPDFDALDLDADGRLTRDELKGTPYLKVFDQIDTNKDGKIDRKEFDAYLKKTGK